MEYRDKIKYIKQYKNLNREIKKREFINKVYLIEIIVYKKIEEYICLLKRGLGV